MLGTCPTDLPPAHSRGEHKSTNTPTTQCIAHGCFTPMHRVPCTRDSSHSLSHSPPAHQQKGIGRQEVHSKFHLVLNKKIMHFNTIHGA